MSAIEQQKQELSPEGVVTLWVLDATAIGGSLIRFTSQAESDSALVFDGETYLPVPVRASGFERSTRGSQPRPEIEIRDPSKLILAMIASTNGLRGARLTRIRTFRDHLDDGADPDPLAIWPPEIYRINRRIPRDNRVAVAFELANSTDQAAVPIPRSVATKGFCDFVYRRHDAQSDTFVIDAHDPCPFDGAALFDAEGVSTADKAQDVCGKRLSDCKLRFGENAPLPYRGFPGLRRFD